MNKPKLPGKSFIEIITGVFFGSLLDENDLIFIKNLFLAFFMRIVSKILFDDKGMGWILNFISDAYIVASSFFILVTFVVKSLDRLLKR
jgi:hypothetical protein